MLDIPSRETLAALTRAADAIAPSAILGLARSLDGGRVSVLYSYRHGIGEYAVAQRELPDALLPSAEGTKQADAAAIEAHADRPIEWHLRFAGVARVLSLRVPNIDPPTRFWVGFSSPAPLTSEQVMGFESLAETSAAMLSVPLSAEEKAEQLGRLELAAGLLPELLRVLDVREVFDRLSKISEQALPHDLLTLGLFNDELTKVTLYAHTAGTANHPRESDHAYPPAVTRAWRFDILDDRTTHPLDADRPPSRMGARSTVRVGIWFDDRLIGGLGFNSTEPGKYQSVDVIIAERLAAHVALALSHHRLAERLAEEARRNEELRARAEKSDLLDEVLTSVIESGTLPEVFDRVSNATQKVLAHDALLLAAHLSDDATKAKVYASKTPDGFKFPDVIEVPPFMLDNPDSEYDIVDDLQTAPDQQPLWATLHGYRSALRVPIRLANELAGGVGFLSFAPRLYVPADLPVARRIAERIALSFARERGTALLKRADEASARVSKLESRVRALIEELDARTGYRRVVGESTEWRQVLTQATQVAATETTVLLLGESGTGKEVVARFLHRASPRDHGPFIALNCAALPEQLLEAELFGYERGAYTGAVQSKPGQLEQAAGGTLFLDEVGEMSPSAQAKFLRVLQEREFQRLGGTRVLRTDARIVAATNRDLQKAIAQGQFREDLYYRLNVFAIRLPPLRDRRTDIVPLSEAFLAEICRGLGRPPGGISRDARTMLLDYHWPGNVRELRNILERAAILCDGGLITAEHLALNVIAQAPPAVATKPPAPVGVRQPAGGRDLQSVEREMIEQALQGARFNKSKAAKALGLSRQKLYLRMRKYGLE